MNMYSTVAPVARSLSAITRDLHTTRSRLTSLRARCLHREPDESEDALWTTLEMRERVLEAEFLASFFTMTGITWSAASMAMDTGATA